MYGRFLNRRRNSVSLLVITAWCAISRAGFAAINLELRLVEDQAARVDCPFNVSLYAISDSAGNQTISAIQVILNWDPGAVQLLGTSNVGGPMWLASGFGAEPYHLNDSLADGDGMWIAFAPFGAGNVIQVPPEGRLLTTFRFKAIAPKAVTSTIVIAVSDGDPTGYTIVFDGDQPNHDITGTLTGTTVPISRCGGDVNGDATVNVNDLLHVINHWGGCPGSLVCCPGDADANGSINVNDLLIVINEWGPCPK